MPPTDPDRALAVVLHDVAPPTWPRFQSLVAALDRIGNIPLTLLVVPDFHRTGAVARDRAFRAAIDARLARGDEVVLHGYHHSDEAPLGLDPRALLLRRVYTREGEFYALDRAEARRRLEAGLQQFAALGWPVSGFVAPAWLMNESARAALSGLPFAYTSDPGALIRLPSGQRLTAPTLVWSARSAWRRTLSRLWNEERLRRHRDAPLIRLGLHPIDLDHADARAYWMRTIEALLPARRALTKRQWLERNA